MKDMECIYLPRGEPSVHYLDCLCFLTPSNPNGVIFVRKSNNTFLLSRRCDQQWKETVMSNTIFFEGKLYTFKLKEE